jgi:glycosyltransferase involved in cell wall biosynthesis
MLWAGRAILRVALGLSADVYHLHDPELLLIAGKLQRARGARVVFDAHEDLPRQILTKEWIPEAFRGVTAWTAEHTEDFLVSKLDGVIAATPHIAARFVRINGHTIDVKNYPRAEEFAGAPERRERRRQICYVGSITRARGIEPLINALPLLPGIKLVLCGQFHEHAFERAMRALPGWAHVEHRGQVDRLGVQRALAESIAGVVTLLPTKAYVDALPVKMFEYMAAELPVIASDFPILREIVERTNAGLCVDPSSPDAIAKAVRSLVGSAALIEQLGQAGRRAVMSTYNWSNEAKRLITFYETLC